MIVHDVSGELKHEQEKCFATAYEGIETAFLCSYDHNGGLGNVGTVVEQP